MTGSGRFFCGGRGRSSHSVHRGWCPENVFTAMSRRKPNRHQPRFAAIEGRQRFRTAASIPRIPCPPPQSHTPASLPLHRRWEGCRASLRHSRRTHTNRDGMRRQGEAQRRKEQEGLSLLRKARHTNIPRSACQAPQPPRAALEPSSPRALEPTCSLPVTTHSCSSSPCVCCAGRALVQCSRSRCRCGSVCACTFKRGRRGRRSARRQQRGDIRSVTVNQAALTVAGEPAYAIVPPGSSLAFLLATFNGPWVPFEHPSRSRRTAMPAPCSHWSPFYRPHCACRVCSSPASRAILILYRGSAPCYSRQTLPFPQGRAPS